MQADFCKCQRPLCPGTGDDLALWRYLAMFFHFLLSSSHLFSSLNFCARFLNLLSPALKALLVCTVLTWDNAERGYCYLQSAGHPQWLCLHYSLCSLWSCFKLLLASREKWCCFVSMLTCLILHLLKVRQCCLEIYSQFVPECVELLSQNKCEASEKDNTVTKKVHQQLICNCGSRFWRAFKENLQSQNHSLLKKSRYYHYFVQAVDLS